MPPCRKASPRPRGLRRAPSPAADLAGAQLTWGCRDEGSGWIPVSPETEAGSSTRVWVSRAGALTGQPLRPAQLGGRVAIARLMTAYVLALLLGLAGSAGRSILYRRRLAGWETDWHGVGPRWTRQG